MLNIFPTLSTFGRDESITGPSWNTEEGGPSSLTLYTIQLFKWNIRRKKNIHQLNFFNQIEQKYTQTHIAESTERKAYTTCWRCSKYNQILYSKKKHESNWGEDNFVSNHRYFRWFWCYNKSFLLLLFLVFLFLSLNLFVFSMLKPYMVLLPSEWILTNRDTVISKDNTKHTWAK